MNKFINTFYDSGKKLLAVLAVAVAVATVAPTQAQTSTAPTHKFISFFPLNWNGSGAYSFANSDFQSLQITNGYTNTYNTNGFFTGRTNDNFFQIANNYPNIATIAQTLIAWSTNIYGLTNGPIGTTSGYTNVTAVGPNLSSYNPYAFSQLGTNLFLIQVTSGNAISNANSGTVVTPAGTTLIPVKSFCDANGQITTNLQFVAAVAGDATTSTNTVSLWLTRSYDGNVWDTGTNQQDVLLTLQEHGTNISLGYTNLSPTFLQGVKSLALAAIGAGTNTGSSNVYVVKAGITGFVP